MENIKKNYQIYKYSDINKLIKQYKNSQVTLEEVVTYSQKFIKVFKNLNFVIELEQNNFDSYIKEQLQYLNKLKNDYSNEVLFEKYPLWGIPVLVKDNMDIKNMATTSGSKYFVSNIAQQDCLSVQKLKDLGAIIIAKTNLSEFSGMSAQHGISELGGKTTNPLNAQWDTSGSSSGSAVACSLGFPLCIGSETFGSILFPSVSCGVFGWKPEQSLLSDTLNIPISHRYDTIGLISNSNENLNYVANILNVISDTKPKRILIERSSFLTTMGLSFWQKDEKKLGLIFKNLEHLLIENGYEVSFHKTSFLKTFSLYKKIANTVYSDLEKDFNVWNTNKDFHFNEYINYAINLPDHFDVSKTAKVLSKEKYDKYIKQLNNYYDKTYNDYDCVIGYASTATFISALKQAPAMCVPLDIENDKITALSLCSSNSNNLIKLCDLISNNLHMIA